jgi:hypothetical protein
MSIGTPVREGARECVRALAGAPSRLTSLKCLAYSLFIESSAAMLCAARPHRPRERSDRRAPRRSLRGRHLLLAEDAAQHEEQRVAERAAEVLLVRRHVAHVAVEHLTHGVRVHGRDEAAPER